jgi:hypothetical protein
MGSPAPSDSQETPSRSRSKRLSSFWSQLVLVVTSVVLTAFITLWITEWSGRLRTLGYYYNPSSAIISKPQLSGKQVKVFVDNKPLDNISSVFVAIFNQTDQDYEDVPIEIAFSPINGKPPQLIQVTTQTSPEFYENMSLPLPTDGSLHFGYRMKVMNRSSSAALQSSYYFEGDQAPQITVSVLKKGLTIAWTNIATPNTWASEFWIFDGFLCAIFTTFAGIYLMVRTWRSGKIATKIRG